MTIRLYTGTFEGNYYGLYFENISCVCHFPTSYPKSTKNQGKIRKNINIVIVTIFVKFENLPKIVFTRASEGDYYGFHFENILCVCHFPTYYPRSTLNNNKIRKNINIALVNIFDKFQILPKDFILEHSRVIITGYILKLFYVYVIPQHITLNLQKIMAKLEKI